MRRIFYYLTEDIRNPKELNEIKYFQLIGRVVVVVPASCKTERIPGTKMLQLRSQPSVAIKLTVLWSKISYLICKPCLSTTDREFPKRNWYSGGKTSRGLINLFWPLKYKKKVRELLPTYDYIYFLPFRIFYKIKKSRRAPAGRFARVFIHDSLIVRLSRLSTFIQLVRNWGSPIIGNVKSWDNPYYSQFARLVSGYLVWSPKMLAELKRIQGIEATCSHIWGSRPFYSFTQAALREEPERGKRYSRGSSLTLGYAAAFCDPVMAAYEVAFIDRLATHLGNVGGDIRILFRPYPSVCPTVYKSLSSNEFIELNDIEGPTMDRYSDSKEHIKFGSDEERICYLTRCDAFLSIATSFTIEASILGVPVIQLYIPRTIRKFEDEIAIYERFDISDHLEQYFLRHLPLAYCFDDVFRRLSTVGRWPHGKDGAELLDALGIRYGFVDWYESARELVRDLRLP